jgi:hypothetical protein
MVAINHELKLMSCFRETQKRQETAMFTDSKQLARLIGPFVSLASLTIPEL